MINVLIADEHELFRLGVRHALPDDMEVVGEAATKEELSVLLRNSKPDIILINNTLLEGGGGEIRQEYSEIKMLVISSENDPVSIHKMSGASVDGFISKRLTGVNMLGEAIRTVMGGEKFYSRDVCEIICRIYAENGNKAKIFTPQEEKVIELCRQGLNSRKIGERLCISHRTVDNHKNNIFRKLGINSTTELIRYATAKND